MKRSELDCSRGHKLRLIPEAGINLLLWMPACRKGRLKKTAIATPSNQKWIVRVTL